MAHIVTQKMTDREAWLQELADAVTDPAELLALLALDTHPHLREGCTARRLFPLRVPHAFIARMRPGDADDPLLRQVLTAADEWLDAPGFTTDPLDEQRSAAPGLLHKYANRALLMVKTGCAVHCRYCFRRHFPYQQHAGNQANQQQALAYIARNPQLEEIILSGGDPLMARDHELDRLISQLEAIPHLKRLRIHSRLPVVIPSRITEALCERLARSRFPVVLVTHVNHAREIDTAFKQAMARLKQAGVTLLNQSVLLKGVNDNAETLAALSEALFEAGILPYYLHLLDRVKGASHFLVSDEEARAIMRRLIGLTSGYLVPRLTREIGGQPGKTPLDLYFPTAPSGD